MLFDALAIDFDEVALMRIRRMSQTPQVTTALLNSPFLEDPRSRMTVAGRQIDAGWAGGAKMYVPLEQEDFIKVGVELKPYHIVAYRSDLKGIKAALRKLPDGKK